MVELSEWRMFWIVAEYMGRITVSLTAKLLNYIFSSSPLFGGQYIFGHRWMSKDLVIVFLEPCIVATDDVHVCVLYWSRGW